MLKIIIFPYVEGSTSTAVMGSVESLESDEVYQALSPIRRQKWFFGFLGEKKRRNFLFCWLFCCSLFFLLRSLPLEGREMKRRRESEAWFSLLNVL